MSKNNKHNIPENVDGVYITDLVKDGAAKEAGIKVGDVIKKDKWCTILIPVLNCRNN